MSANEKAAYRRLLRMLLDSNFQPRIDILESNIHKIWMEPQISRELLWNIDSTQAHPVMKLNKLFKQHCIERGWKPK